MNRRLYDWEKELLRKPRKPEKEWIAAAGGTETPFVAASGRRLLYCWNPVFKRHAYLDLDTGRVLSDEEADAHMNPARSIHKCGLQ